MAAGDVTLFNKVLEDMGDKVHNMSTDTFKIGLIDSVQTPSATSVDPRWGADGTVNFLTDEVTPGGNYSSGGESLSAVITDNWSITGGLTKFDGDDVAIAQNAGNPSDARWGIVYNDTDTGKRCVGFIDLGAVKDLTTGPFSITWAAGGIFTVGS